MNHGRYYTFKTAWRHARAYSQSTGVQAVVMQDNEGDFIWCGFSDGGENTVRRMCEALDIKFVRRTYVLK